jgi:hypothetical protein
MRPAALLLALAAASPSLAQELPVPESEETVGPAVGAGVNLTPQDPGWQLQLAVMGENRDRGLTTQIGLGYEVVGTRLDGEAGPSGRVSQVALSPFTIWAGYGGVRAGAGFDVSYAFLPVGASGEAATGLGWGGRVGAGLSLRTGRVGVWLFATYRWLSGPREGGFFFDLLVGRQ